MTRWGREPDEIRLDIAYAVGSGLDIDEYLAMLSEARNRRSGPPEDGR